MALSIQNNIASLVAQQNLSNATNALNTSLQRLSSGLQINTGADGPAAYVISNEQGAQIAGLQSAINNTNQAVSLVQTGEGALSTVNNLLVQIRGLALSAANSAVNDPTALAADQAQIQNALQTIDNISKNTQFGTKSLLDGSAAAQVTINTGGSNVASVTPGINTAAGSYSATITQIGQKAQLLGTAFTAATNSVTAQSGAALASGATATNSTYTGTYNVVVTQQGQDASITAGTAAAALTNNTDTQTLTISGGGIANPIVVNLTNANAATIGTANTANTLLGTIQTALGAAGTVSLSNGDVVITSSQYAGPLTVAVSGQTGTNGAGFNANGAGSVSGSTGQVAQVQLSGGGLAAPVSLTASGAGVVAGTGNATGLSFTLATANATQTVAAGTTGAIVVAGNSSITLNGTQINLNAQNAGSLGAAVNTLQSFAGTTAVDASSTGSDLVLTAAKFGGNNFTFSSTGTTGITNGQAFAQSAQDLTAQLYDGSGNPLGTVLTGGGTDGLTVIANTTSTTNFGGANSLSVDFAATGTSNGVSGVQSAASGSSTSFSIADGLQFQIGANANQTASLSIQNTSSSNLGTNVVGLSNPNTTSLAAINVTTTAGANDALNVIDAAISQISTLSGNLGAFQTNTLQATAGNLQTLLTNTTAAQSVIRDTDFAAETSNYTKDQVLVQAGTTVLSNANATSSLILTLLKNA